MSNLKTRGRGAIGLMAAGILSALTGCAPDGDSGLPDDFPDSVPVISGEVEFEAAGSEGWVVEVTSSAEDPLEEAATALEGAGFDDDPAISGDGGGAANYSNGEYDVLLIGQGRTVVYTVTPTQE